MKMNICTWITDPIGYNKRLKKYKAWRNRRNAIARKQRKHNQQHR